MSGTVGGDLATLRQLFTTLGNSASDIEAVCTNIERELGNTVWTGTNAEKFREAWAQFKPTLNPQLVTTLNEAREDVRKQHNNLSMATGESDMI
jgi:uncharacterized protein YukE